MTRRLRRGWSGCRPEGAVLSFEAKESTKESLRHGDSRGGGPPCCALFANIGVPGTAVPGSCICSGLPVANCLRQLCPLGTRSLSAQASVCGSPFGAVLDLGSLRSPAGKKPFIAHFAGGARYVARSMIGQISPAIRRAPNSPFSAVKMGGPFSLRCLSPLGSPAGGAGHTYPLQGKLFLAS